MKARAIGLLLALLIPLPGFGQAILIEDGDVVGRNINSSGRTSGPTRSIWPLSQRSVVRQMEDEAVYSSAADMRTQRRMGFGAQVAGTAGLIGLRVELNFSPENSAIIGFGGGPGYSSANFHWKRQFNGRFFSPYVGIGYARWYNSSDSQSLNKATPSMLSTKFLSEEEKRTGKFEVDLLTPAVGVVYHMLSGPQVGVGYFGEVAFLTDFEKPQPTPTAGLGAVYYF